jgi:hypothetical protein
MKNICLLLSAFCLATTTAFAGKEMTSANRHTDSEESAWNACFYTGGAFSMDAKLTNGYDNAVQFNQPGTATVTPSVVGDNGGSANTGKLGKMSSFIGLSVGREFFTRWLHADVSYELYTPFTYAQHYTGATSATGVADELAAEVLGDNYLRSFSLNHQSALFNLEFCLPEDWAWAVGGMEVSPVLGAGVGVGINTVTNFQAVGWSTTSGTGALQYTTLALPKTKAALAWQVNAGLAFRPEGSEMSFGLAYRFYEGGKFSTQNSFMLNDSALSADFGKLVELTAWNGKLRTNQVVMFLDLEF